MTVRILYHREPQGWWADSPDLEGWTVAGLTYDEVRELAADGVSFAVASAAEDRGEVFCELRFISVRAEHYLPAPT